MSNDRQLIMCRKCKRFMIWAKYYPSCRLGRSSAIGAIDKFIDQHIESCWPRSSDPQFDLEGETMFEFETEGTATDDMKWEDAN